MAETAHKIPRRADPFEEAFRLVERSKRTGGGIHFGAQRTAPHNGIDLFVPENTPLQAPAERAVLIGTTLESSAAGRSMGNALIFFVPNEGRPYFVALLHLSARTFQHLRRARLSVGSVVEARPGSEATAVAYSGSSACGPSAPHVHVTATTEFMFGGRSYTAEGFMEMYRRGELGTFLQGKNFYALMPASRYRQPNSLAGYLDPAELIRRRELRLSAQPQPPLVASRGESRRAALPR
jgi:hypothetical protein